MYEPLPAKILRKKYLSVNINIQILWNYLQIRPQGFALCIQPSHFHVTQSTVLRVCCSQWPKPQTLPHPELLADHRHVFSMAFPASLRQLVAHCSLPLSLSSSLPLPIPLLLPPLHSHPWLHLCSKSPKFSFHWPVVRPESAGHSNHPQSKSTISSLPNHTTL